VDVGSAQRRRDGGRGERGRGRLVVPLRRETTPPWRGGNSPDGPMAASPISAASAAPGTGSPGRRPCIRTRPGRSSSTARPTGRQPAPSGAARAAASSRSPCTVSNARARCTASACMACHDRGRDRSDRPPAVGTGARDRDRRRDGGDGGRIRRGDRLRLPLVDRGGHARAGIVLGEQGRSLDLAGSPAAGHVGG
jgi:hypothetical protein